MTVIILLASCQYPAVDLQGWAWVVILDISEADRFIFQDGHHAGPEILLFNITFDSLNRF